MPTAIIRQATLVTLLTCAVWLGFAAVFPDARLDLAETVFIFVVIALVLTSGRWALRAIVRRGERAAKSRNRT
jgi:hypothetical protein